MIGPSHTVVLLSVDYEKLSTSLKIQQSNTEVDGDKRWNTTKGDSHRRMNFTIGS